MRDITRFLRAYLRTRRAIRFEPFQQITQRIATRKAEATTANTPHCESQKVIEIVSIFDVLRAFTFTARLACLFDSLVLIEYLHQYRIYPLWVIGVRTSPFAAHSWLQYGNQVINGAADFAATFTPVLTL